MKILHVIDSINIRQGGTSFAVVKLAENQVRLGHNVVIVSRDYQYLGPMVKLQGVKVRMISGSQWIKSQGGWGPGFHKLILEEAEKADVVHSHGLWLAANCYARKAANMHRKPLVVSPHGMMEKWSLGRSQLKKSLAWGLYEKENMKSVGLFIAMSKQEAESIYNALQVIKREMRETKVVVSPIGIGVPKHLPKREILEKSHSKLAGKKWMVFMSRVHPKKGLLELAKAWSEVRQRYPGWELVIAGPVEDGKYADRVRKELKGEGVWTGELAGEEKWCALGNAGFVALPSFSENFGIVVAETLAAARPVLTTTGTPWGAVSLKMKMKKVENIQSMNLEERGCGVICEPGIAGVRMGLSKMLKISDAKREEMGVRGRKWMKEEFSWEKSAKELVKAYQGIV